jgi:hypothetical protein
LDCGRMRQFQCPEARPIADGPIGFHEIAQVAI